MKRTSSIKYLGVVLDEKLTFINHITVTANRVRKLIYIFKKLRCVMDKPLLRTTYIALAQSVITYCISVWGGAASTHMIVLERAQRSLLKVMHSKPRMFSTHTLLKESAVLSVRQLYIFRCFTIAHIHILNSPNYGKLIQRRIFLYPLPSVKTHFAKKFGLYTPLLIYRKINATCDTKTSSLREAIAVVRSWLSTLNYVTTEKLLSSS
jgi:hypothetical protein